MIAHVFVDAENIPPSVTFKVVEHFGREHTITKVESSPKKKPCPTDTVTLTRKFIVYGIVFTGKILRTRGFV